MQVNVSHGFQASDMRGVTDRGTSRSRPGMKVIPEHDNSPHSALQVRGLVPSSSLSEGTLSDSPPSTIGRSAASLEEGTISASASSYRSLQHVTTG
jgi:hypothetical protein